MKRERFDELMSDYANTWGHTPRQRQSAFDDEVDDANLAPAPKDIFDGKTCIHCKAQRGFYDEGGFLFCNICKQQQSLHRTMSQDDERRNFQDGPDHRRTEREPQDNGWKTSVPSNKQFAPYTAFIHAPEDENRAIYNKERFCKAINALANHIGDAMFNDVRKLALAYASDLSKGIVHHNSVCKADKCRLCMTRPDAMMTAAALLYIARTQIAGQTQFGHNEMAVYLQGVNIKKTGTCVRKYVDVVQALLNGSLKGSYVCGAGFFLNSMSSPTWSNVVETTTDEMLGFLKRYTSIVTPLVQAFGLPYHVEVSATDILKKWLKLDILDSNTPQTVAIAAV